MNPNNFPSGILNLIASAPPVDRNKNGTPLRLSQNKTAELLSHYWPAVVEHLATLLEGSNPDRSPDFSAGVDWAVRTLRREA